MTAIKSWLKKERNFWNCDFIGVAVNAAGPQEAKEIRWLYTEGPEDLAHQKIRLRIGRGIAGMVWKTARPQSEQHLQSHPEKLMAYPISRTEKLDAALAVPVLLPTAEYLGQPQEVVGVLMVGYRQNRQFSGADIAELCQQAATVAKLLEGGKADESV